MTTSMEEASKILGIKSRKALEIAKQQLLLDKTESEKLCQALEYYAKNWDDTLHPGMIAVVCEAVGGDVEESLWMQVAMLFLTAAIDIHDDIIDGSQIKNGKYTVFGKFGKDVTLLVGDGIMMKGMTMLHKYGRKFPARTMEAIVSTIETTFTEAGIAHTLELSFRGKTDLNPEKYFYVLKKKAAILEAHTRIGALIGRGTQTDIKALGEYGRILGTLITLRDEFIDIFEAQELNDRIKNGYLPLPLLYAFENPQAKVKVMNILSKPKILEEDMELIVDIVFKEKKVESLKNEMKSLAKRALQIASNLTENTKLNLLITASLEDL